MGERPGMSLVCERLLKLQIPTKDEWQGAFVEQWFKIREDAGSESQAFFKLGREDAERHLADLAERTYAVCARDPALGLGHTVAALDRIEVTLAQLVRWQALQSIPASVPSEVARQRVTEIAVQLGNQRGWRYCHVMHIEKRGSVDLVLVLSQTEASDSPMGVVKIDQETIAIWSSFERGVMSAAIAGAIFDSQLFSGVTERWNSMVEFVGQVAQTLYPNSIHNGAYGIAAQFDRKRIGVPFPVGFNVGQSDRVQTMKLGESLVPFLMFGEGDLQQLVGLGAVNASALIASWLSKEWGPPPVSAH
jgi:hypothetical protein